MCFDLVYSETQGHAGEGLHRATAHQKNPNPPQARKDKQDDSILRFY